MENIFARQLGFYILYKCLKYKYPRKQASNMISATHAVGSTILSCLYLKDYDNGYFTFLKCFSTAYFLHDSIQMLYHDKMSFTIFAYLYHHLSSTYLLHATQNPNIVGQIFFWGELSNWPTYPLYHLLHQKGNNKIKIKVLRTMQKCMYTCIRVPIITQIIRKIIKQKQNNIPFPLLSIIPIYFMGLAWSYKILSQK